MWMPLFLSMIKEVYRPSPGVMGNSDGGRGTVAFSCLWFLSSMVLCWLFFFLLWPSTCGSNFMGEGFLLAYSSKGYSSWWWTKFGGRNRGGWWVQSEDSGELLVSPKASPTDFLLRARQLFFRRPTPSEMTSAAKDQVFNHMSQWGMFYIQTTTGTPFPQCRGVVEVLCLPLRHCSLACRSFCALRLMEILSCPGVWGSEKPPAVLLINWGRFLFWAISLAIGAYFTQHSSWLNPAKLRGGGSNCRDGSVQLSLSG